MITGKEALIALANGEEVENWNGSVWWDVDGDWHIDAFLKTDRKFRLKPRTITLNGIDIEIPKELRVDPVTGTVGLVYGDNEKAKQVVEALREVFK